MYIGVLPVCMSVYYMHTWCLWKLEPEQQMIVSCHTDDRN